MDRLTIGKCSVGTRQHHPDYTYNGLLVWEPLCPPPWVVRACHTLRVLGVGGGDTCQAVRTGAGSPTDGFLKSHSATQAHPASTHSFTKNSSPCPQITRHARGGRAFLTATPLPRSLSPPAFFLPSSIEDAAFISWLQISNFFRRASRQPTQSPPTLPMARCPALAS